ncbi:hypothetical protein AC578_5889 [Pseudocercospora eumusae]|uniref:JmjC domain-containing protein n=1 Tax=Pseudocercospora eumusae TaxID=321146 RepID=A0A139HBE5_9PEZI|nr:hypothetical protein AC578_5889 [Pseudocercospora eumusae]
MRAQSSSAGQDDGAASQRARCEEEGCSETAHHTHCKIPHCPLPVIKNYRDKRHNERHHIKCPHCAFQGSTRGLQQHRRECIATPSPSTSTGDALAETSLRAFLDSLDPEHSTYIGIPDQLLDSAQNLRSDPYHDPLGPKIFLDKDLARAVPGVMRVGIWVVGDGVRGSFKGEFWLNGEKQDSTQKLGDWVHQLFTDDPSAPLGRIMNYVPCPNSNAGAEEIAEHYRNTVQEHIPTILPDVQVDEVIVDKPDFLLIPRFSKSDIHYDNPGSISTVYTDKECAGAVKLWLFWPPSEARRMVQDDELVGDSALMTRLQDASFALQRRGESIFVPAGWLHWVYTLHSSVLYGGSVDIPGIGRPMMIQADTAMGMTKAEAVRMYVSNMRKVLENGREKHKDRNVQSMLDNLQRDAKYLRTSGIWNAGLIKALVEDVQRTGSCRICRVVGSVPERYTTSKNIQQHIVRAHFENQQG